MQIHQDWSCSCCFRYNATTSQARQPSSRQQLEGITNARELQIELKSMLMLLLLLLLLWPGVGTSPAAFFTPHRRANQNPLAAAAAPSTAVTLGSRAQLRVCPSMWRPFFPHSLASSLFLLPLSLSRSLSFACL